MSDLTIPYFAVIKYDSLQISSIYLYFNLSEPLHLIND